MSMFCFQCEQTSQGTGCCTVGVCGKSPETANLQDLIVHIVMGISRYAHAVRPFGMRDKYMDTKVMEALFMTLTNVNFDRSEHMLYIKELLKVLMDARNLYENVCRSNGLVPEKFDGPLESLCLDNECEVMAFAHTLSIEKRMHNNADIVGLQELITYGVKGLSAYAHHAYLLGYYDEAVATFIHEVFSYLCQPEQSMDKLLAYALETGKINLLVMELLDRAHTETFGHPEPTQARITAKAGKCILVSGHDLNSLHLLLQATAGKGINVYTHGELLPALAYPGLKKYPHLIGNIGGAWQNQVTEFAQFPGAILMTTNCLKPPAESYRERLFTMDVVGFEDVKKIHDFDFSALIECAQMCPGYAKDEEEKTITIGFARNSVLSAADKVIEAVKAGDIKHFFLVGGCDGAEYSRNYFTDFAGHVPKDCVILTLGCGKFRFNKEEYGDIGGIPRLLDLGQCNDAYSAIKIASALAEAFGCGINDLPLSLIISWFEQKAVAVLLTLLYLGVRDIRLGPALPAFVTANVLNKLVEAYAIKPVGIAEKDMELILAG